MRDHIDAEQNDEVSDWPYRMNEERVHKVRGGEPWLARCKPTCNESWLQRSYARDKQREHQKAKKGVSSHDDLTFQIRSRALQAGNALMTLIEITCPKIEHAQ